MVCVLMLRIMLVDVAYALVCCFGWNRQNVFADYLYTEGLKVRSGTVRCAYLARLDMNWRDKENNNYCGVYTMRHMETYMGQSSKSWDCNL
ncbi:hypothetical protein C2S52_005352 [Perilla frutescens var. hirtella]|nr:hypothetical protein C2S51_010315 [Perilla frutescens var. frutescens]KAH6794875.1 hypothetical protein C2S52_005352 [Perilla frutescens var. hirtella]